MWIHGPGAGNCAVGMGNMVEILLTILAVGLYCLAVVPGLVSLLTPGERGERWAMVLTAVGGAVLLAILTIHGVRDGRLPAFGRFEALACYTLATAAAYLYVTLRYRVRGISGFLMPYLAGVLAFAAPAVTARTDSLPATAGLWLGIHILAAFVGYGLFTLASVLAIAYLVQDYNLKHKRLGTVFQNLPSLGMLDHLMSRQIASAFLMLTVSMGAGVLLVYTTGRQAEWLGDPKVMATAMMWLVYAFLLHLRIYSGRHGTRVAWATLIGLACVLFTFVGVHMVAESVHDFVLTNVLAK